MCTCALAIHMYIAFYLCRLHIGKMEVVGLTKLQLSAGVLSKSLFNTVYAKEATHCSATRRAFLQEHYHHPSSSLITVDTVLMLSLQRYIQIWHYNEESSHGVHKPSHEYISVTQLSGLNSYSGVVQMLEVCICNFKSFFLEFF